ncbi:MAG: hypothetical protein IT463_07245 [Planctomycetes bacterium]|nr:hypothetical protein [Planctomycetota bacterium]
MKTAPVQVPPGSSRPTSQAPGNTQSRQRQTQLMSLEPPRRGIQGAKLKPDARMDSMAGPSTISSRNRSLMGNIGREKTQGLMPGQPAAPSPSLPKPGLKRADQGAAVDLGGAGQQVVDNLMQRRSTRRIPKPGGGMVGESAPLASMDSGRRPAAPMAGPVAPPPAPQSPGAPVNVPPVVKMPVPVPSFARRSESAPPPPSSRGNTLAGVSAEDLLGEEGRRIVEDVKRREAEARARGDRDTRRLSQGGPQRSTAPMQHAPSLQPGTQDSARRAFNASEYASPPAPQAAPQDVLAPQDSFLAGPTRVMQREVLQTPMPAQAPAPQVAQAPAAPPPDDLGYEKPVDFGEAASTASTQEVVEETDVAIEDADSAARESAAQDEMEQRVGYLLWLQGVITIEEVQDALTAAGDTNDAVRDLVINTGFTEQLTLYRFLARHESLAPVDLTVVTPTEKALGCLRPAIARAYRVVPFAKMGDILLVAAAFPFDPKRLLELRRLTASKVKLYVVTEEEIEAALQRHYPGGAPTPKSAIAAPAAAKAVAHAENEITGEGEALAGKYDPTISGEDSGLYTPPTDTPAVEAPAEEAPAEETPAADVGLAELDYEGAGVGSDSTRGADAPRPATRSDTLSDDADLDESTLSGGGESSQADELDLGGNQPLDSGPEDHDPFKD